MPRDLTYDYCYSIAKNFTRKVDFKNADCSAYSTSVKRGWINKWFNRTIKPKNYWTYDRCKEFAQQFKYMTQFRDANLNVYLKSKKNDWIKDWEWLINDLTQFDLNAKIHLVYAYIFDKTNSVYVGRTMQLAQRDYAHRNKQHKNKNDEKMLTSLQKHAIDNNCEIPKPTILEENLTLIESQDKEEYWVNYYKQLNFNILNVAKTGVGYSSIGGGRQKWAYEKVKEEALKYKSRGEFYKKSTQAYRVALKYKWIDDFTWFIPFYLPKEELTFESIYKKASQFTNKHDFKMSYPKEYVKCIQNKWFDKLPWLSSSRSKISK